MRAEVLRELIRERQQREQEINREIEITRAKLIRAEENGFTDQNPAETLKEIKSGLGRDAV